MAHFKWMPMFKNPRLFKKLLFTCLMKKSFDFWRGINCTTLFSDHNVLQIIKTKWRFGGKNDSPKELLQSENKNAIREDFKNTHNSIDTHNVTGVAIQDHNRITHTKLYFIFVYYGKY